MKTPAHLRHVVSLALGSVVLGACQSAPNLGHEPYKAEWVPLELPQFVGAASPGKKVFVTLQDFEANKHLKRIETMFEEQLVANHKLVLVDNRAEADFAVQLVVRFFNESPAPDNARALREQLKQPESEAICGGFADWVDASCGAITLPHAGPIVLQFEPKTSNRGGAYREWNLLIDVAVGEKGACAVEPELHVRRVGRLLGFASGPNMTRDQALDVFLTGKRPVLEPAKREAPQGSDNSAAPVEAGADTPPPDNDTSVVDVLCSSGFLLLP
jgi:hypothetical protein